MTEEQKKAAAWSTFYAAARADMRDRYARKRVRAADYRAAFDAGRTVTEAVDAIAASTQEERKPNGD